MSHFTPPSHFTHSIISFHESFYSPKSIHFGSLWVFVAMRMPNVPFSLFRSRPISFRILYRFEIALASWGVSLYFFKTVLNQKMFAQFVLIKPPRLGRRSPSHVSGPVLFLLIISRLLSLVGNLFRISAGPCYHALRVRRAIVLVGREFCFLLVFVTLLTRPEH